MTACAGGRELLGCLGGRYEECQVACMVEVGWVVCARAPGVEGGRQPISIDGCTDGPRTRANVRCPRILQVKVPRVRAADYSPLICRAYMRYRHVQIKLEHECLYSL